MNLTTNNNNNKQAGIYIHIPFCKQACHYCDFHFSTSLKKKEEMIKAIQEELILRKNEIPDAEIQTIYFGGGTPSVMDAQELDSVLNTVFSNYSVSENPEITLEANPDDLVKTQSSAINQQQSDEKLGAYKSLGINRLSIGIQSFFEQDLILMNRAHNSKEARNSIDKALKYFDNISIDLIYGIQGLDNERWRENIDIFLSYNLPHLSSYALTIEPKTALSKFIQQGKIKDVDDNQSREQFYILTDILKDKGYINYEISNFGKSGSFSQNNTAYWQGKPYLGIGPSAHSYDGTQRSWNISNNQLYINAILNGSLPNSIERLSNIDSYNEYIMTGLRTIWGVSLIKVEHVYGSDFKNHLLKSAESFIKRGLLEIKPQAEHANEEILIVTDEGKFLVDGIASDLFIISN